MVRRVSPSAGTRPDPSQLVDLEELHAAYRRKPSGPVSFGTSGHRGTSLKGTFTEAHVLAISEAIARHRKAAGITGPLFVARDTHALSEPAFHTAVSVFSSHGLDVRVDADEGYTPTPALSHAILTHPGSDGIVLTPSHNPPEDGGYKYNPPSGGPAGTDITKSIEGVANELLAETRRIATAPAKTTPHDYVSAYVDDLPNVIDIDAIREANVHIGAHPLGGASVAYFKAIAERHQLNLEVVSEEVDPTFRFVPLDHDGKIRMDCSSPYVMSGLIEYKDQFDVAVACDPDADRHGIVTPSAGLLNPNHYLAVAIHYLFGGARDWGQDVGIGKTLVSSTMIDLVAHDLGRTLVEVPVGFKWFVDGLIDGTLGFGGEESAGASFLRKDGTPWSTDKDGILLALLAAEITAKTGKDPGQHYEELTAAARRARLQARGLADRRRAQGEAPQARAGGHHREDARGRRDHGGADEGPGQRRGHRRREGHDGQRLVRGPPVRHRGHLQALRGEPEGRGSLAADHRGSQGDSRMSK